VSTLITTRNFRLLDKIFIRLVDTQLVSWLKVAFLWYDAPRSVLDTNRRFTGAYCSITRAHPDN
jgi:hypothetical protein